MATVQQIRDAADADATAFLAALRNAQQSRPRALQLLWTHRTPPVDAAATACDGISDKPSNESVGWNSVVAVPATLKSRFCVHVYDGPRGRGFIVHQEVMANGNLYRRSRDFGPEGRSAAWARHSNARPA